MSSDSRMAKILRRLAGKEEENQTLEEKERDMSALKNEKLSKKDLDFDLGDIAGDVARSQQASSKDDQAKPSPFDKLKKSTPVEPIKKTVDDHLEECWICFIQDGKIEHRELKECTAEEFGLWLMWVYPPAKEFLEKNIRLYDNYEKRKSEFLNLIAFLTKLPRMFAQYGESKMFPRSEGKKENKKSGGKDE